MPDNEVKIVVTTQDKSSTAVSGLKAKFTELNSALSIGKQALSAVKQVLDETVGSVIDYSKEIEKLQAVTGTSAEETSALIQVADDARIEFGTLQMAARSLTQNGIQPNIDNLAKLADEYNAIQDPVKKTQFVMDMFGSRAGPEMAKLLAQGSDAIRENAAEAEKLGLIMSEKNLKAAKDLQVQMDNLEDAFEGVKIQVGNALVPALTDLLNVSKDADEVGQRFVDRIKETNAEFSDNAGFVDTAATALDLYRLKQSQAESSASDFNQALYDQEQAVNASKKAAEEATTATDNYAASNTAMFDSINTGLDSMISNWLEALDFMQNGGLELQQRFSDLQEQWAKDPGDPEIERQMEDLYAQTLATKTIIGQVDATTAAQNISDTLGVSLEEAKQILDDIIAKLAAGGTMNVDVNVTTTTTTGEQKGGGKPKKPPKKDQSTGQNYASGGVDHANSATTVTYGEAGGETAIFIPDGKTPADVGAAGILGGGGLHIGAININGAGDPQAVARAVRAELEKLSRMARNGMGYAGR